MVGPTRSAWAPTVAPTSRGACSPIPLLARIGVVDAPKLRQAHARFLGGDRSLLTQLVSAVGGEIWLRRELGEPLPEAG